MFYYAAESTIARIERNEFEQAFVLLKNKTTKPKSLSRTRVNLSPGKKRIASIDFNDLRPQEGLE